MEQSRVGEGQVKDCRAGVGGDRESSVDPSCVEKT